jgi:hypothetical protein
VDPLDRIGLKSPVVQAGTAGGVSGPPARSHGAGALGTIGIAAPRAFAAALADARRRAGSRPVAANLLVPFLFPGHSVIVWSCSVRHYKWTLSTMGTLTVSQAKHSMAKAGQAMEKMAGTANDSQVLAAQPRSSG